MFKALTMWKLYGVDVSYGANIIFVLFYYYECIYVRNMYSYINFCI